MPKKRNTAWSRTKKEKQIITARLIEISLKVDDYIYKHKPISVWEAEQYIREVSTYKVQCSRDERSLQVIEKLTRCMRAIILDHQERRTDNHSTNNDCSIPDAVNAGGSMSPVYSIPDEDRTQFTQTEGGNNNVEIIDLSNIDDDDDSTHNGTNNTAHYAGRTVTVAVEIHRGMSSLSLREVEKTPDMAISTEINCSQSILNNFDGVEQMQQNEINITPQGADPGGLVVVNVPGTNVMQAMENNEKPNKKPTAFIEPNKILITSISQNKPITNCNAQHMNFKTVVNNKRPLKVTNATNYGVTNGFNEQNNITSQKFYPATNNNIPENQRQTWYDSNRTCTINNSNHTLRNANHFTQLGTNYKDGTQLAVQNAVTLDGSIPTNSLNTAENNKQTIATENSRTTLQNSGLMSKPAVVQENTGPKKKKRCPKKKGTDDNEIKTKNKKVFRRNPKTNKENTPTNTNKNITIPIYNENVVDDLSWVENIRYVREIKNDENDLKLSFEESFWDNYYLPANWSENVFV